MLGIGSTQGPDSPHHNALAPYKPMTIELDGVWQHSRLSDTIS